MRTSITRRNAMAALAAGAGLGVPIVAARAATGPSTLPDTPSLLVAGPAGGTLDRWASSIAEPLGARLLGGAGLTRENVGGPDGVTGANQFQVRTAPDGATALLAPGSAVLAWLAGDPRVRFDAGTWAPLWGGGAAAVVASRIKLGPGVRARVAVQSLIGPELAVLLALTLMGVDAEPVTIGADGQDVLQRRDVDVVFLRGRNLRARIAQFASRGWSPRFGFGAVGADGVVGRERSYPDLPIAQEFFVPGAGPAGLSQAMRPVATAATLDVALVLPIIAPAATMAWWRRGCEGLAEAPSVQAQAASTLVRPMGAGQISASLACVTVDVPVLLGLRRWLAERYQWRPA